VTGTRAAEDWTFEGAWPYEPRWFDSADGRMHFIDEGPQHGRPVVLVHGNPTWGFLYRHFVPALVGAGHRVIVPDHLGFGRSDKPDNPGLYRIARHAQRLDALLESLDLQRAFAGEVEQGLVRYFRGKPVTVAWAMRDPAFTPAFLERWLETFPNARLIRIDDAGHYLQEDAHERITPELLSLLDATAGVNH
jgi:pimeloyl-ACP methyl ester carboxylesterase